MHECEGHELRDPERLEELFFAALGLWAQAAPTRFEDLGFCFSKLAATGQAIHVRLA